MPLAISSHRTGAKPESSPCHNSQPDLRIGLFRREINAYIAIRDQLLAEAEEVCTKAKLASKLWRMILCKDASNRRARPTGSVFAETDAVLETQTLRSRPRSNRATADSGFLIRAPQPSRHSSVRLPPY